MRKLTLLLLGLVSFFAAPTSAHAYSKCFVVVGGWDWQGTVTTETAAQAAWTSAAQTQLAASDVRVRYIVYDARNLYYWQSAPVVAQAIINVANSTDCVQKPLSVVAYSMGGTVMDEMLAQADATDPYYNAIYPQALAKITEVWTIDGVHGGSELASVAKFLNDVWAFFSPSESGDSGQTNLLGNAVNGLTLGNSPRGWGYNDVDRPVYAIGGYDGWWYTDPRGEDDGVLSYASQFGIKTDGSYFGDWRGHVPGTHWATSNFFNAWQSDSDHYSCKDGNSHTVHKLETSPITGGGENDSWVSSSNPSLVRSYGF